MLSGFRLPPDPNKILVPRLGFWKDSRGLRHPPIVVVFQVGGSGGNPGRLNNKVGGGSLRVVPYNTLPHLFKDGEKQRDVTESHFQLQPPSTPVNISTGLHASLVQVDRRERDFLQSGFPSVQSGRGEG